MDHDGAAGGTRAATSLANQRPHYCDSTQRFVDIKSLQTTTWAVLCCLDQARVRLPSDGAVGPTHGPDHHVAAIIGLTRLNAPDTPQAASGERVSKVDLQVDVVTNDFDDDPEACRMAGMNDHISKPASPEVLHAMLVRWLRKSPAAGG